MSRLVVSICLAALTGLGGSVSPVAAHGARVFSFPNLARYSPADASQSAEEFIQGELAAGASLGSAEDKLHAAGMGCTEGASRDSAICHYHAFAGAGGGGLGEMWWTMYLQADLDGQLTGAHFDQARVAMTPKIRACVLKCLQ
ncbi:MAG TPA: hypothetical protein VGH23_01930 [Rhizomicrobium sp.]|jgi:hypothetical protein